MNLDNLTNLSRNDVLRTLGLAPRFTDYFLPAFGIFTAGAVIGATTALMLAPKSGVKLRKQIRDEMRTRLDDLEQRINMGGSRDEDRSSVASQGSSQGSASSRNSEKDKSQPGSSKQHAA